MPARLISNPAGAFGQPTVTNAGLNEQLVVEVVNNSGTYLHHGDVMTWDNATALSTQHGVTVSGAQTATQASFTLTANASTASYAATGGLLVVGTVTTGGGGVPIFLSYTGINLSTFTGVRAATASITNGLANGATIFQWPQTPSDTMTGITNYVGPVASFAAAPSDGGRYVTLSIASANDPEISGVVTTDASASTNALTPNINFPGAQVAPGATFLMAVGGVARVSIGAGTVANGALLTTSTTPGLALATGTLGNLLGIALEANTAKDANNTIRAALKIG